MQLPSKSVLVLSKLLIGIGLLVWLFWSASIDKLIDVIQRVDWVYIGLACVLINGRVWLFGRRWQLILANFKVYQSTSALTKIHFIGIFCNNFFPSSIGGDVIRGLLIKSDKTPLSVIVSSIFVERILGVVALVCLSGLAFGYLLLFATELLPHTLVATLQQVFLIGAAFALILVLFQRQVNRFVRKINLRLAEGMTDHKWMIFMQSVALHFIGIVALYLLSQALGESLGFFYFVLLCPLVIVISMLPITINGLGLREGSFVLLFSFVGMTQEAALMISLLWLLLFYSQCVFGFYFAQKIDVKRLMAQRSSS